MKNTLLRISCMLFVSSLIVLGSVNYSIDTSANKEDVTVIKSGILAEYDVSDMFNRATAIITGTMEGTSEPFMVKAPATGIWTIYTDYQIKPTHVLRGDVPEDSNINIRIDGGTVGDTTVICEESPNISPSKEHLFFLYNPNMGGGLNTAGDYYYIVGVNQGIFAYYDTNVYKCEATSEVLDISQVPSTIVNEEISEDFYYQEFKNNMEGNLENGFITQDEYNDFLDEVNQYAEIVS